MLFAPTEQRLSKFKLVKNELFEIIISPMHIVKFENCFRFSNLVRDIVKLPLITPSHLSKPLIDVKEPKANNVTSLPIVERALNPETDDT
ncbi:hypothetical protein JCM14469_24310 [Desulfatiferula olefinivorans]